MVRLTEKPDRPRSDLAPVGVYFFTDEVYGSIEEWLHVDLLVLGGVFVFADPYFGEIVGRTAFDQFYDEHRYQYGKTWWPSSKSCVPRAAPAPGKWSRPRAAR